MSAHIASFTDHKPAHLKRMMKQSVVEPRAESIISDMADGNLVTEFFFSFAGFTYAGSSLVLTIIGILGDNPDGIKLFDDDIAKIAGCNERTVRRWRKAYLAEAKGTEEKKGTNFYPLEIIEGEYNHAKERYEKTLYRITFAEPLEQAVAAARARADYQTDRLHALEEAALFHYEDIPQAPPPGRKRKPARAIQTPIADLNRAAKKIIAAQTSLKEMPAAQRAAFADAQSGELRAALAQIREQMAEFEALLSGAFTTVEKEEVKGIPDKMSGIPPPPDTGAGSVRVVREETRTLPPREHTPEDHAVFDSLLARAKHKPQVTRTNVEIVAAATTSPPTIANLKDGQRKPAASFDAAGLVSQAEAPPHELEYVPDAPEPTLTEFDAKETELLAESSNMKKLPKVTFSEEDHAPPKSKMERDIEERGGTKYYF